MQGRVAKNAVALYIRLIVTMLVYLYTSRILLKQLGAFDYGIYDVVCGVIYVFSFFTLTFAASSQRFFAFYLGKRDTNLNEVFSTIVVAGFIISFIILFLAETIGIWFVNNRLNIPSSQMNSANWVYQSILFSYILNTTVSPCNSFLVADEKMDITSFIGIVDVILKLISALILTFCVNKKLTYYSLFLAISAVLVALLNIIYWMRHRNNIRIRLTANKKLLIDFGKYSGWYLFGTLATSLREHGVNVLLNIFFNPVVNAGRAVAFQINTALTRLSKSLFEAVRPFIIKTYAKGNISHMNSMIEITSRFSLYILLIISIPVIICADELLRLWLNEPPLYAVVFLKLILVNAIAESINSPLVSGLQATGKVKNYHLTVSLIYLLNLPLSYLILKKGGAPETTLYVSFILIILCIPIRLVLCYKCHQLQIMPYLKSVILRGLILFCVCYFVDELLLSLNAFKENHSLLVFCVLIAITLNTFITLFIGFSTKERKDAYGLVKNYVNRSRQV